MAIPTRRILTFGDSNTHGTKPLLKRGEFRRFDEETRWPMAMLPHLPSDWAVVEEGLPGRTAQFDDAVMGDHMNGIAGLNIALRTHGPIDAMTLMLGTNDVKARFGATPDQIAAGIAMLLDLALGEELQTRHNGFRVLLISPAPVHEVGFLGRDFYGGREKSLRLAAIYRNLAAAYDVAFLDAGDIVEVSETDGIHWEADGHLDMAAVVAQRLINL